MLNPAEERDEATHHAVKNRAINRPNFRGGGGGGGGCYFTQSVWMLLTFRTPDPVMVKA